MEDKLTDTITRDLLSNISSQFEIVITEALKRKGYEFNSDYKLMEFIKIKCRCENDIDESVKTYFVNDIPFLMWDYKFVIPQMEFIDDKIMFTSTSGRYTFI